MGSEEEISQRKRVLLPESCRVTRVSCIRQKGHLRPAVAAEFSNVNSMKMGRISESASKQKSGGKS